MTGPSEPAAATPPAGEDVTVAEARAFAARHFAARGGPGVPSGVWGVVVALVAAGTVMGAFVFSYYYLRLGADAWPPEGTDPFPLGRSVAALAMLAVAVAAQHSTWRAESGHAVRSAVAGAAGTGFLVLQAADLLAADLRLARHAYDAICLAIQGLGLALVAVGVLVAWSVAWVNRHTADAAASRTAVAYWWGTGLVWAGAWAVLYVTPRVA